MFTHIVVIFDLIFELTKADLDEVDLEKRNPSVQCQNKPAYKVLQSTGTKV